MSIFNEFFKKEKPVFTGIARGVGGFGFGGGAAGGGGPGLVAATGGTVATPGNGYVYHFFTSDTKLVVFQDFSYCLKIFLN